MLGCRSIAPVILVSLAFASTAVAGEGIGMPLLWGKVWAIGYGLVALGVLLGLIPVAFPGRRKAPKKRDV